jgi:hypothetical protein
VLVRVSASAPASPLASTASGVPSYLLAGKSAGAGAGVGGVGGDPAERQRRKRREADPAAVGMQAAKVVELPAVTSPLGVGGGRGRGGAA